MIVKDYIKTFEKHGMGMFVHFGLYSILEKGEWIYNFLDENGKKDYPSLPSKFNPDKNWARDLVSTAKAAGCKYITLTTRHHDGFSLYDTQGLNDYDAPHALCGRDLVREFVDACREQDIVPFFYHTLLDWYVKDYNDNFPKYLEYLRKSVELLCKNYGKIGGIWFDGMWNKWNADWEEDALYATIRKYQPEAMIINNTGMGERGALGHIELDSVTFERGKPQPINLEDSPKYVASEMCQVYGVHWGYAKNDFCYKSLVDIINDLCVCRRYGANFLMNVGPRPDGSLRPIDKAMFETLGEWVALNEEALRAPRPSGIAVEGKSDNFILENGNDLYLFCHNMEMRGDANVVLDDSTSDDSAYINRFALDKKITSAQWLDSGEELSFTQKDGKVCLITPAFKYGEHYVVRVAKLTVK